jgi:hypothetical protein
MQEVGILFCPIGHVLPIFPHLKKLYNLPTGRPIQTPEESNEKEVITSSK